LIWTEIENPQFGKEVAAIYNDYIGQLVKLYDRYGPDSDEFLKLYLGLYSLKSIDEFVAEAFCEYKLNSKPSKFTTLVGELIDKYFKK